MHFSSGLHSSVEPGGYTLALHFPFVSSFCLHISFSVLPLYFFFPILKKDHAIIYSLSLHYICAFSRQFSSMQLTFHSIHFLAVHAFPENQIHNLDVAETAVRNLGTLRFFQTRMLSSTYDNFALIFTFKSNHSCKSLLYIADVKWSRTAMVQVWRSWTWDIQKVLHIFA